MTSRERIVAAVKHRESDRLPIDLGAMDSTGITAIAYNRLKSHLGIKGGETRIFDPYQQVVLVEKEVREAVGADVLPLMLEPNEWKDVTLGDGSSAKIPAGWNQVSEDDGSIVARNSEGIVTARMPSGGFYFEPADFPYAAAKDISDIEKNMAPIERFDWPWYGDEDWESLARRAKSAWETTEYALMGNFCAHIFAAGQLLRGYDTFLIDLILNPGLASFIMDRLVETYERRFEKFIRAVGPYVQIINVNDDLGTQETSMISPALFRKMIKPRMRKLYGFIKSKTAAALFLHSDGSIYGLIPDLIEVGVDILNPVQYTANNMDPAKLKREFGKDLVFWGGGCDTQRILPFLKPEDVRTEVKKRIADLAPGGGFVFNQVHNIQADVPPENVVALFETARAWRP